MGELLIERDEKLLNQYYENFQKSLLENEKFWKRKIAKLQERMIKSGHDIYVIQLLNCNGAGEETKNQKIWYLLEEKAKKLQKDNEENFNNVSKPCAIAMAECF